MVHPGGLLGLRLALRAVAKATLSCLVLAINSQTLKQQHRCYPGEYGASGRIRTSDRSVRSRVLYPAELRVHLLPRIIGRLISMSNTFSSNFNNLPKKPDYNVLRK